jgi:hypothetical protein
MAVARRCCPSGMHFKLGFTLQPLLITRRYFFFSVVARSNTILKQLVLQAKKEYEAEAIHRIQIYFADSHGSWRWTDSRHKRPMGSIVLNPGVKEMLLNDTKDFLKSEKVRSHPSLGIYQLISRFNS